MKVQPWLGNYEMLTISLTATVGPDEEVEDVFKAVDKKIVQLRNSR